ncbi:MAG: heparinase II/III family protein [Clostridia bacterium]|nr:heparinase II/III family protein [Clostridia bacterium]
MKLLGKSASPEFWQNTVRNGECYKAFIADRMKIWKNDCEGKPIPELKYSAFKLFKVNGNRQIYEDVYFMRRRNMAAACHLALIYPEEEKYLVYLQDIIFSVLNEYTWCLPAHNTALERNNNVHIDLFASETGFALAEIYHMMGERLEPLIRSRIVTEINRRIFDSYFAGHEGSGNRFWWEKASCTNNWTSVCMGSIGCTTMLMRPDLFERLKPTFDFCMNNYLSGFGDDGYCLEGVHYWHYGFGFFTVYAEMVRRFTDGAQDYFKLPKVRAIATFIQKMFLSGRASVSFADGTPSLEFHLGLCHFLKSEYGDEVKVYSPEFSYVEDGCSRFSLVTRYASWLCEDYYNNPAPDNAPAEYYGADSKWYVKRTESFGFAAKAGNNDEHHNHNDIGSFIFAKGGRQLLCDLGRGEYTRQYFRNETRYGIIECRSLGHSVPYIAGCEQRFGKQYCAKDVVRGDGFFSFDMAGAYACEGLNSLKRSFTVTDKRVTLTDLFDYMGTGDITERLVLSVEPCIEGGRITVGDAFVSYDEDICTVSVTSEPTTTKSTCYMLDFKLKDGVREFKITIE